MVRAGSEEEKWCKERHLENNTFGEGEGVVGGEVPGEVGDGGAGCWVRGEEVRVVLVGVGEGRIADWKGGVRDWCLDTGEGEGEMGRGELVNGVV